ncbi:MAG TPA: VWA domain-containing protein [Bryobacteraceae bacterium]|nr:VWA domain-containing protein [Bryobacteraceae bacterium]
MIYPLQNGPKTDFLTPSDGRGSEGVTEPVDEISQKIVEFCRYLRANGFPVGVSGTLASVEVSRTVPHGDRQSLKFGLRAALCSSKKEWDKFDDVFEPFWNGPERANSAPAKSTSTSPKRNTNPAIKEASLWLANAANEGSIRALEIEEYGLQGAGLHARLRKTDFSQVPLSEQAALERLAERLLRRASWRLSRTLKIGTARDRVDLRRTIRQSIGRGGDPLNLRYRAKKLKPARLVVFLDVSGSMKLYSLFLLRFAHALQKYFRRAATFVFSTTLADVTEALRSQQLPDALRALSEEPAGWSGGTKIGESLRNFNLLPFGMRLSRDTLFVILSDGWDTGEPALLAAELQTIKRRVKKLIWLNPLLGLAGYQPVTRGMAAALPHVDVFAAAHSLDSLLDLERHLTRKTIHV